MQPLLITSAANERFRRWKKITESPRAAKKLGMTLAEGAHLAQVILEKRAPVYSVILREHGLSKEAAESAGELAAKPDTRVFVVNDALYDQVSPVEHGSGLTVEVKVGETPRPHRALNEDALYLDGVQDAGNTGTLVRTALAACIRYIAAAPGSAGLWSPKVLRAGMGAHLRKRVARRVGYAFCRQTTCGGCTRRSGSLSDGRMGKNAYGLDDGGRRAGVVGSGACGGGCPLSHSD